MDPFSCLSPLSTMAWTTMGFFRMCWPRDLRNSMPVVLRVVGSEKGRGEVERGSGRLGAASRRMRRRRVRVSGPLPIVPLARHSTPTRKQTLWPHASLSSTPALPAVSIGGESGNIKNAPLKPPPPFLAAFLATPPATRRPLVAMVAWAAGWTTGLLCVLRARAREVAREGRAWFLPSARGPAQFFLRVCGTPAFRQTQSSSRRKLPLIAHPGEARSAVGWLAGA